MVPSKPGPVIGFKTLKLETVVTPAKYTPSLNEVKPTNVETPAAFS